MCFFALNSLKKQQQQVVDERELIHCSEIYNAERFLPTQFVKKILIHLKCSMGLQCNCYTKELNENSNACALCKENKQLNYI